MKRKLLITGSTGFIASNFIRHVLKNSKEYSIASIDKVEDQKFLNTVYANKGHQFYLADITDNHIMNNIFTLEQPDIVVNFAASSFVDKSNKEPQLFIHNNVLGTQVLIDAALKAKVKTFVQISTDECLGSCGLDDPPWTEESPVRPRNSYAATKAAAEMLVQAACNVHGLEYIITRSVNCYGPRQPRRNLIPVIIANILENKSVPIYGQGLQVRNWIFVQDNCSAILHIIENGQKNEIYNISSKNEYSNMEIFHHICQILKEDYNIDGEHLLTFVEDRPGHDQRYAIDNSKLLNLGWKPSWNFKNGLSATIDWYVKNKYFLK